MRDAMGRTLTTKKRKAKDENSARERSSPFSVSASFTRHAEPLPTDYLIHELCNMQSLLRWSVENSTPNQGDTPQRKDIDPEIIDHILGKPDAQLMKEFFEVAVDPSNDEDARLTALDDLEMVCSYLFSISNVASIDHLTSQLVENIDNANGAAHLSCTDRNSLSSDLKKLNMWQPLHGLLSAATTTDPLKMQTLWVIGTALQNNPAAQLAVSIHPIIYISDTLALLRRPLQYLTLDPMPAILSTLSPSSNSAKTRSRAMYALSGLLKHNAQAVRQLTSATGWHTIRGALEGK